MNNFKKRSHIIQLKDVGFNFQVYNGIFYKNITVTKEIISIKFGSYVFTRKRGKDTKTKK